MTRGKERNKGKSKRKREEREKDAEALLLGLKVKTNSGQHGGCALQSRCKGISRMSGNWDDATLLAEQG